MSTDHAENGRVENLSARDDMSKKSHYGKLSNMITYDSVIIL
jgi:hypothetical protein